MSNDQQKPKGLEVGDPISVKSTLTREEWKECSRTYGTYSLKEPPQPFECEFKWRFGMGANMNKTEIALACKNMDELIKKLKELQAKNDTSN